MPWRSPKITVAPPFAAASRGRGGIEWQSSRIAAPNRPRARSSAALERGVIGPMDLVEPPAELAPATMPLAPDRAGAADARGDQAEPAPGARRLDQAAGRQRRRDQRRIDLALVAVEVDLGARRPGDEGGRPGRGGAPDQPVDEPVLERLQRRLGEPRGAEQSGPIVAPGMGHGQHDRRRRPLGADAEEGRGRRAHSSPSTRPGLGRVQSHRPRRLEKAPLLRA